jgi:hypothetical protein
MCSPYFRWWRVLRPGDALQSKGRQAKHPASAADALHRALHHQTVQKRGAALRLPFPERWMETSVEELVDPLQNFWDINAGRIAHA